MPFKDTGVIHNEVINTDSLATFFLRNLNDVCAGCGVGVIASPWGHLKMSGNIFPVTTWKNGMEKGATIITWIKARQIAKHSKVQAPPPSPPTQTRSYPEVNGAKAKKILVKQKSM